MINNKKVGEILFLSKLTRKYILEKRSNIEDIKTKSKYLRDGVVVTLGPITPRS